MFDFYFSMKDKEKTDTLINIFLDDCRETPNGFIRTFSVDETIDEIKKNKSINILSLDNDLGENLKEGREVLNWLEEEYYTNKNFKLPNKIIIHSSNPCARKYMMQIIEKLYNSSSLS